MIRNHMIDPENTPPRNGAYSNAIESDDPWFTQSPSPSPTPQNNVPAAGNSYGFNQFGYNPYPAGNTYSNTNPTGPNSGNFGYDANIEEDYGNEPPLLEELGIRFDHILDKTQAVLYLHKVSYIKPCLMSFPKLFSWFLTIVAAFK